MHFVKRHACKSYKSIENRTSIVQSLVLTIMYIRTIIEQFEELKKDLVFLLSEDQDPQN